MAFTTSRLNGYDHMGKTITFLTRNGNEVTGTIKAIRHRSTGTYLELEDEHGVYQTDDEAPCRIRAEV